jgi:hypothetical protein
MHVLTTNCLPDATGWHLLAAQCVTANLSGPTSLCAVIVASFLLFAEQGAETVGCITNSYG